MPKNLSAAEVDAFRARLCAVAQQRFAKQGADGVSMRQLADALGCSPMTPYRYFRNKDEILAAVRTAAFDRFAAALEEAARKTRGDLRAARPGDGRGLCPLRAERSRRLPLDVRPVAAPSGALSRARPRQRPRAARDERRARGAGEGRHLRGRPSAPGHVFWATMHGLIVLHLAGKLPAKPDFRAIQREAMRLLVAGARSGAAVSPRAARRPARRKRSS